VLWPEVREAAEKEKHGGSASSSVEGSTWSERGSLDRSSGLCSLVVCRVILRFFEEDVLKAELLGQLEERLFVAGGECGIRWVRMESEGRWGGASSWVSEAKEKSGLGAVNSTASATSKA
jgi:hypothetical protein